MIPLATTTITVTRVPADPARDAYDPAPDPVTVATGIRAVIGQPTAAVTLTGGDEVAYRFPLTCDPTDLQPGDTIVDAAGIEYRLDWARLETGFGLDHMTGSLRIVTGAA